MNPYGGYTTGMGYHIAPIAAPQPQQVAPTQQAAPHAPAQAAPWKFGDLGDIQNTQGGEHNLSMALRTESAALEGWMNTMMHHHGIDPTTVDYSRPVSVAAHQHFLNKVSALRQLQGELLQGRENQKVRNAQIASGRIEPGAPGIDASQPMNQQQFEQGFRMPTVGTQVQRHNALVNGIAKTQAELAQHQQSWQQAVDGIHADARDMPEGQRQDYVQRQIRMLNPPVQGIEREQTTNQNTSQTSQWGTQEHVMRPRAGHAAPGTGLSIGEDIVRASRGGVQQTKTVAGRPYGFSPVLADESAGGGRTFTGIYYDPATHRASMGVADKEGKITLHPMKYTNGYADPLAAVGQVAGINSAIYRNLYNELSDAGLLHTDPVSGRQIAAVDVESAYPGLLQEPHAEAHRTMQVAHQNNSANLAKFEQIRQSGEGQLNLPNRAEYLLSSPTAEYRVRGGSLDPDGDGTMELSGATQVEQRVFDRQKGKFGDWHAASGNRISGLTGMGGFSEHEINDQYINADTQNPGSAGAQPQDTPGQVATQPQSPAPSGRVADFMGGLGR